MRTAPQQLGELGGTGRQPQLGTRGLEARREIAEAQDDITGLSDEGLTWRLHKAAEARNAAEKIASDDSNDLGEDRAALSNHLQRLIDGRVWEKKR